MLLTMCFVFLRKEMVLMEIYMWVLAAAIPLLGILYMTGHLQMFLRSIYGDFTPAERNKFLLYGTLFFFVIGIYWSLRCVKDSIFNNFVGADYIFLAKMLSLVVVFPLVIFYSYLVDIFPRHRLFYAMAAIYAALFLTMTWFISSPIYGIEAPAGQRWGLLGWLAYVLIESYGSLLPALFYSFMADTTTPEQGKKGYFITATFAQLGAIIGSGMVAQYSSCWGVPFMMRLAGLAILVIIPTVAYINWAIPKGEFAGYQAKGESAKKSKPGFIEGFRLMLAQPYLLGILVVIAAFETAATIFDLQFKILIAEATKAGGAGAFATVAGEFGVAVSLLALISLLCGIGSIGRKVGLMLSLASMPVLIGVSAVLMFISPSLSIAFWVMVAAKGINYALGQPSKEQLYIPTTKEAKYKSKAWIEMFGSRGSKAIGAGFKWMSGVVKTITGSANAGLGFLAVASLCICGGWFLTALYLGKKHKHAVDRNEVVC